MATIMKADQLKRRGVTLTEALVAIFVCGIGLIALMTLFPLGALNMAQALRDDRAANCAANASAVLRAVYRASRQGGKLDDTLFENALKNGPVFLDPIGKQNGFGNVGGIPRLSLNALSSDPKHTMRWFSMLDDIEFDTNGKPMGGGAGVRREHRFSWAYLIRQPGPGDSRALQYSVVVYQNRPITMGTFGVNAGEVTCGAEFTEPRRVTLSYSNKPNLRAGGWILETTGGTQPGFNHFYRAANVKDVGGSMIVELATPLRRPSGGGSVTVLDHVIEVFERNTLE